MPIISSIPIGGRKSLDDRAIGVIIVGTLFVVISGIKHLDLLLEYRLHIGGSDEETVEDRGSILDGHVDEWEHGRHEPAVDAIGVQACCDRRQDIARAIVIILNFRERVLNPELGICQAEFFVSSLRIRAINLEWTTGWVTEAGGETRVPS